jgi:hypothetical protein
MVNNCWNFIFIKPDSPNSKQLLAWEPCKKMSYVWQPLNSHQLFSLIKYPRIDINCVINNSWFILGFLNADWLSRGVDKLEVILEWVQITVEQLDRQMDRLKLIGAFLQLFGR